MRNFSALSHSPTGVVIGYGETYSLEKGEVGGGRGRWIQSFFLHDLYQEMCGEKKIEISFSSRFAFYI